jgi:hypothetical protein
MLSWFIAECRGAPKASPHWLCECVLKPRRAWTSRRRAFGARTSRRRVFGAHPRCSDSPPRFVPESPLRGPCSVWPTAAPLVRNSPRGWAPKTLPNSEVRAVEPRKQSRLSCWLVAIIERPAQRTGRDRPREAALRLRRRSPSRKYVSARLPRRPAWAATPTPTARLTANRTVVRDLGAHPRGEFRTSGAAVGQIDTRAALAAFLFETRRTV